MHAEVPGYLLVIELDKLVELASTDNVIVKVEVVLGDFLEKGTHILSFWSHSNKLDYSNYQSFFHVGEERATI
jgi:uncharacterized membrane protein